jgi:hypothetical protein
MVRLATNGFSFFNGGNLLVGTTTDAGFKLDVNGTGRFTSTINPIIFRSTNATTMWTEYYYNTSTISGYIGSGTGLIGGANASDFIVRSEADFVVATNGGNRRLTIASTGAATFASSVKMGNASLASIATNSTGADVIVGSGTNSSPAFQVWDDNSLSVPRFIVTRGGNVGVGTTSPTQKLVVEGSEAILSVVDNRSFATGVGGALYLLGNYRSVGDVTVAGYIKGSKVNSTDGDYGFNLTFGTQTYTGGVSEKMRITSFGNVLIGTTTDAGFKLDVAGTGRFSGKSFASGFTSRTGTISIASGVTSTITNMDVNGVFLVNIQVNGGSLIFNATNYFMANNTNGQYVNAGALYDGANVTLSNSGSAIQITNDGFSTLTWQWSVFIMPYALI